MSPRQSDGAAGGHEAGRGGQDALGSSNDASPSSADEAAARLDAASPGTDAGSLGSDAGHDAASPSHDAASPSARDAEGADSGNPLADAGRVGDAGHIDSGGGFSSTDLVWFGGDTMPVLFFDGTSVSQTSSPVDSYEGMWGASANDVFVLAWDGTVLRYDGATWGTSLPSPAATTVGGIFGLSGSDVWIGIGAGAAHFDGTTWSMYAVSDYTNWAGAFWGFSTNDIWTTSYSPYDAHWNGSYWETVSNNRVVPNVGGMYAYGVWASSTTDVWAVGQNLAGPAVPGFVSSTVDHYDGTSWSMFNVPAAMNMSGMTLTSVWGSGSNDVWAVGDGGLAAHYDGTAWSVVDLGTTANLTAVMGTSARSVWVAGASGTILHWDGATWKPVPSGTTRDIWTLWATAKP